MTVQRRKTTLKPPWIYPFGAFFNSEVAVNTLGELTAKAVKRAKPYRQSIFGFLGGVVKM